MEKLKHLEGLNHHKRNSICFFGGTVYLDRKYLKEIEILRIYEYG